MKSKEGLFLTLLISILTLTACSAGPSKENGTDSDSTNQATSSGVLEQSQNQSDEGQEKQESEKAVSVDQNVTYNGSYYSVEGKYGPILIVNKHYPLASSYNPGEDATAKSHLLKLIAAMKAQGYAISDQYSGFRSYETQAGLYQNYVNQDGQEAADRYSARPGYSEHQTGLAFDLIDNSGNLLQGAEASQWLLDNAHKYGFIVRYQPGKEASTGYMAESWHLRYIGQEAADIAASGQSLEEYFGITGGDYQD